MARTVIKNDINNIIYVEPNYTFTGKEEYDVNGLNTYEFAPNLEDYSIYLNLEVELKGREISANNTAGNKKIVLSWHSTSDSTTGTTLNFFQGSRIPTGNGSYVNALTTNYTNATYGAFKEETPSTEMFGIKSVDISYRSYMTPDVTIEFVDVRGISVFGQKEYFETNKNIDKAINSESTEDITNTFFQCFFTFPYPKFTLFVKGFYGQPVSYELTCYDFRARFDSSTGNFACTAKFVGYHFSFLSDVMMNAILAAPLSDYIGADYWASQNFMLKGKNGDSISMPTIAKLMGKIQSALTEANKEDASNPAVIEKEKCEEASHNYNSIKNAYLVYINAITSALSNYKKTYSKNDVTVQLFIRSDSNDDRVSDFLLFVDDNNKGKFSEAFKDKGEIEGKYNELKALIDEHNNKYSSKSLPTPAFINDCTTIGTRIKIDGDKAYANDGTNKAIAEKNPTFYENFKSEVSKGNVEGKTNPYIDKLSSYWYNDNSLISTIDEYEKNNADEIKEHEEEIEVQKNQIIADVLGFRPSIENITRIIMAHFQTFAYMLFKTSYDISSEKRMLDSLGVAIEDLTDIRNEDASLPIPPFPKVTKIINKEGYKTREETWVGDFSGHFREEDLVNGILNGVNKYAEEMKRQENGEFNGETGSVISEKTTMAHPLTAFDLVTEKDTYARGGVDVNSPSSLLGLAVMRAINIFTLNNFNKSGEINSLAKEIGKAESDNFLKKFNLNSDTKEIYTNILGNIDDALKMAYGEPSASIPKPNGGKNAWPWRNDVNGGGIIDKDGNLIICRTGKDKNKINGKTYDRYSVPVQNMSWPSIKRDIITNGGQRAIGIDDYVNSVSKLGVYAGNLVKKNQFKVVTDVKNIPNKINNGLNGIEGLESYKDKMLGQAEYTANKLKYFLGSNSTNINTYVLYKIDNDSALVPGEDLGILPKLPDSDDNTKYFGDGTSFNNFIEGKLKDKNGKEIKRKGERAFDAFSENLSLNDITISEFPGVDLERFVLQAGGPSLFGQKEYYEQTDVYKKAIMFLLSLSSIYQIDNAIDKFTNKEETISILPISSILCMGAFLWAYESEKNDKRKTFLNGKVYKLLALNTEVKQLLMRYFSNWVKNGVYGDKSLPSFETIRNAYELRPTGGWGINESVLEKEIFNDDGDTPLVKFYLENVESNFFENYITVSKKSSATSKGIRLGNRDTSKIIDDVVKLALMPCTVVKNSTFFFANGADRVNINTGVLKNFLEGFLEGLKVEMSEELEEENNKISQAKNPMTSDDIRVGVYRYCKLLYDKWIGGSDSMSFNENWTMHAFFDSENPYFHFIDSYYNKIGEEFLLNIGDFYDKTKECFGNSNYSLLAFLSLIYSKNRVTFLCIQNFLDLSKKENMEKMFDPSPYTDTWEINTHPNFIALFPNEPSSSLDGSTHYNNDSFMINDPSTTNWPEALKSRNSGDSDGYSIPAFGVSYGRQYQSYFKDISISMDNPTVTEQSIKAQFAISCNAIDGENTGDRSQAVTYGEDLYPIYSNNSYTCNVTMMGCAWVQPLMYFVLNNVPMFRGTYLIEKVTHHVEPGNMTTNFMGVRMSNVSTRLVKDGIARKSLGGANDTFSAEERIRNIKGQLANIDNDCPYKVFPVMTGGKGGGIPMDILNSKWLDLCKRCSPKVNTGEMTSFLQDTNRTVLEALIACIGAEYRPYSKTNGGLMAKVSAAMVCNRFQTCIKQNNFYYICATNQLGSGNRAATESTYKDFKDILTPVYINGPASLVGAEAKVQQGYNVEIWNRSKRNGTEAPSTHTITIDDMQRVYAYCTMGGYDYDHIGAKLKQQGKQSDFEPHGPNSNWHKGDFLFQEFNSVFSSDPSNPDKRFWNPAPKIDNNSDNRKVSDVANGFLHALNQSIAASSVGGEVGIDVNKSSGNTIWITNAKMGDKFGIALDVMLNAYSDKISNVKWVLKSATNAQNQVPLAFIVAVKEGSPKVTIQVVSSDNINSPIKSLHVNKKTKTADGKDSIESSGMHDHFCKALVKKYKSNTPELRSDTNGCLDDYDALFDTYKMEDCNKVMEENGYGVGAGSNSTWAKSVETIGKWYEANIHNYNQSRYTFCNLTNTKVRHDCSGYVSACLQYFKAFNNGLTTSSAGFTSEEKIARILEKNGFRKIAYSWDEVQPFDIVSHGSHVEILASKNRPIKDWGWGSCHDGINGNAGMPANADSKAYTNNKYKVIWRYVGR